PRLLLSNAESGKDAVQNIVRRRRAGNCVEGLQRAVEIEQQKFVRKIRGGRIAGFFQHGQSFAQQILLAEAGDKAALYFELAARRQAVENSLPQFRDARTRERG